MRRRSPSPLPLLSVTLGATLALLSACDRPHETAPRASTKTDSAAPITTPPADTKTAPKSEADVERDAVTHSGGFQWGIETPRGPGKVLASATKLNDTEIKTTNDGPWTIRAGGGGRFGGRFGGGGMDDVEYSKGAIGGDGGGGETGGPGGPPRLAKAKKRSAPRPSSGGTTGMAPPPPPVELAEEEGNAPRGPLKAGSTDDNADFKAFLSYLDGVRKKSDLREVFQDVDVRQRRFITVIDAEGRPLPGARMAVIDPTSKRAGWQATTYGDGTAPFYPGLGFPEHSRRASMTYDVEVDYGGVRTRVPFNTAEERLTVTLQTRRNPQAPVSLEVLFLIDTTGSMGDEIAQIKSTLLNVTGRVRALSKTLQLSYGAVLFRDLGDAYVTKTHPFTEDIPAFDRALQQIVATGGGDYPESVNQGLDQAVSRVPWSKGTAKLVFLIGDAPPHMDYQGDVRYIDSAIAAVAKGIKIHSVAASGLEPKGSPSFRQVAQLTRGKFIFIEYGGDIKKSASAHGVGGDVKSNNLDDILFDQIKSEFDSWGH